MSKDNEVRCAFDTERQYPKGQRELYTRSEVTGLPVSDMFIDPFVFAKVENLFIIFFVHVVGKQQPDGSVVPVVSPQWIEDLFEVANGIWSQACIKLFPYRIGSRPITEIFDVGLGGFITCIAPGDDLLREVVEKYDAKSPEDAKIVNLYIVNQTNGIACAEPFAARIFLPSASIAVNRLGRVLAHEVGHLLLNPVGINDSDDPNHLMYHGDALDGARDGLYMSECLAARSTANENLAVFSGIPGPARECTMRPRLGNNLVVVANEYTKFA